MKEKIRADWNQIVEEMSEENQQKELKKRKENHKPGMSMDGYVETWRKKFTCQGVDFELALLRYYTLHDMKFKLMGIGRNCDQHAVVESIKGDELVEKISKYLGSEFLYHDTLHKWNDTQNRNEQLDEVYNRAIEDIDTLQSTLQEKINEAIEATIELWELKLEALKKSNRGKQ